jgi:hypothetical protein
VSIDRSAERPDPIRTGPYAGAIEERRARSTLLGAGTLACPHCDVPVALGGGRAAPADPLDCPYCGHYGAVRDFLSLAAPTRPAHVEVRVVLPAVGR